jgi:hypothetical protein
MVTSIDLCRKYRVTESQISACTRYTDEVNHRVFYLVESASHPGTFYKVSFNPQFGVIQCKPHNGEPCRASLEGLVCWHIRASHAHSVEIREEHRLEAESAMQELSEEMAAEARAHGAYTIEVDPISSSLDGCKWETAPSGRSVPMR